MNKHCKKGIKWGLGAVPILIIVLFSLGDTEKYEELVSLVLVLPAPYISVILRADLDIYGGFGLWDICMLVISFLIYFFIIGFTLGSVSSLITTRFSKNKAISESEKFCNDQPSHTST